MREGREKRAEEDHCQIINSQYPTSIYTYRIEILEEGDVQKWIVNSLPSPTTPTSRDKKNTKKQKNKKEQYKAEY